MAVYGPTSQRQAWFLQSDTFLTIFGGAASGGKSYVGLMRFLEYIDDPAFVGYVFRKNATDLSKEGGLFMKAVEMFQGFNPDVTFTTKPMVIKFPHPDPALRRKRRSGATISFTGLDDKEGMNAIQGIDISAAMVDEACQIGADEFWWLTTRLRTAADMSPNIWLTCNPDFSSFVLTQFVHWWLYPRDTKADILRVDLAEAELPKLRVGDVLQVEIRNKDGNIKTVNIGSNITYCDNVKFFGASGSISVNTKVHKTAVRLEVSLPCLDREDAEEDAYLIVDRYDDEGNHERISEYYMSKEGEEDIGGRPDLDKNGSSLYYLNVNDEVHMSETLEELYEKLPSYRDHPTIVPKQVKFIGATCKDNPTYLLKNPDYESTLQNQPRLKKEQLYFGNWYAQEEGTGYFRRTWLEPLLDKMPPEDEIRQRVRCFDLAGSEKTEANPDPDWTACVLIAKTHSGMYIIEDVQRVRMRAGSVENWVLDIVKRDIDVFGRKGNYRAFLPEDPAAAGKIAKVYYSKLFDAQKIPVRFIKVGSRSSKMKRFEPFAASSENGLIQCLKAEWNEKYFFELEVFDGGVTKKHHDDMVDATSDSFNVLATKKELPKINARLLKMS